MGRGARVAWEGDLGQVTSLRDCNLMTESIPDSRVGGDTVAEAFVLNILDGVSVVGVLARDGSWMEGLVLCRDARDGPERGSISRGGAVGGQRMGVRGYVSSTVIVSSL